MKKSPFYISKQSFTHNIGLYIPNAWILLSLHTAANISNMDKLIPHNIDSENSYESNLMGDVKAGFPSPAEDIREKLDLIKLLVKHKASTFFFRVGGVSIADSGMSEGDIVIVDRAVDPYDGCKAVCYIDGEFCVKRVEMCDKSVRLVSVNENDNAIKPIDVTTPNDIVIWGVVTYIIKKM